MNTYDVGDKITITGTFTNGSVVADPVTIRARYRLYSGSPTTLIYGSGSSLTRSSTGVYVFDIYADAPGRWHYRMDDSGSSVATESYFQVQTTQF